MQTKPVQSIFSKTLLTAAMLLLTQVGITQVSISGVVSDLKGETLIGANVFIVGSYDGASTDADGRFTFITNEVGSQQLKVAFIGYEVQIISLELNGDIKDIQIVLQEKFSQLKAVRITAGSFEASDSKKAVALKPLDIVTTAGAAGDVTGALQTLPGTTAVGESGRLFVRGGSAEETQTYVDGMLVHEPYSRTGANVAARGRFNPFIFSGTVFTTGGYSAEYGQALSSVLVMETKGIELEDEWNLGIMSVGADAAGTKVWEKGSITGSIGYIDLTPYNKLVPQNLEFERMPSVINASLSIRQRTSKTGLLKLYGMQSNTKYGVFQEVPGEEEKELISGGDDNSYLNVTWRDIIAEKWTLRTGAAYSLNNEGRTIDGYRIDERSEGEHFKAVAVHAPSEKLSVKIGADLLIRDIEQTFGEETSSTVRIENQKAGLFLEGDVFLSSDLAIRGGLRLENTSSKGGLKEETSLAPRLMAAYRLGDDAQVSLAYGLFYQDTDDQILFYSEGLDQERASHYILNYQYTVAKRTFRIEAYQKDYHSLVKYTVDSDGEYTYKNNGDGYARGIDLWFRDRKTIKNLDYWLSYSYLDTERDYRDYPNTAVPTFAAAHSFSVVAKRWVQDWRSQIGATFSYTSPRNYDDPNKEGFLTAQMDAIKQLNMNWAYLYRENVIFYTSVSNVLGQDINYGYRYASTPDSDGVYASAPIVPGAKRMFFLGCFITLSKKDVNQLDKLN
jgi:hypothetical protein